MGIFSNEASMTPSYNVPMAEGYNDDQYSAQVAMIESYQNSFAIFDGVIRSDIQEAAMKHGGASDYDLIVFSESVIGDLFNKIKEFFKKLWAKIKSIFHNFMARFDAKFGKSNKEFIKKYRKDIYGKDLSDFEVEYRKRTSAYLTGAFPDVNTHFDLGKYMDGVSKPEDMDKKIQKEKDDSDFTNTILEETMGGKISVSNPSEYDKEVMDYYFDESSKDEINLTDIVDEMMAFKDRNKGFKKAGDSLNKAMSQLIKQIEKDQNEALKTQPITAQSGNPNFAMRRQYAISDKHSGYDKDTRYTHDTNDTPTDVSGGNPTDPNAHRITAKEHDKNAVAIYQKTLSLMHRRATCVQTAASKFAAITLKAIKFDNAQNRRIIAKVVAYKRKEEAFSEEFADLIEWESDCVGVY